MKLRGPFLLFLLIAIVAAAAPDTKPGNPPAEKGTRLYIQSGTLYAKSGAAIHLHGFDANIRDGKDPKDGHQDKIVSVAGGSAMLAWDDLSKLLNGKLDGHQLQDVKITPDHGKVKISGKMKKAVSLPFTVEGPVTLTREGFIRLHTESMKTGKLPIKGLAELLGLDPQKMVGDGKIKGVSADKDGFSFDPDLLWGLPVHGRVTRLSVQARGLLLVFGGQGQKSEPRRSTLRAQAR
ncbi:MAG: hypothetical protein ACR2IF_16870 [Terriglobales bacterium]